MLKNRESRPADRAGFGVHRRRIDTSLATIAVESREPTTVTCCPALSLVKAADEHPVFRQRSNRVEGTIRMVTANSEAGPVGQLTVGEPACVRVLHPAEP
jgi:hypothetical protein